MEKKTYQTPSIEIITCKTRPLMDGFSMPKDPDPGGTGFIEIDAKTGLWDDNDDEFDFPSFSLWE